MQHIHGFHPPGLEAVHAHSSAEWASLQSDRDSLARINKRACDEWAEDHTHLQALCRKAGASVDEVEGGDDGMLTLQELADMLEAKLRAECAALREDKARMDKLEKRGVQAIYFHDGGQMNPASMSLRAALDLTETID